VRARESEGVQHGVPVTDRHGGGGRHCRRHGSVSISSSSGNCSNDGFHQREHIAATASVSPSTNVACA